MAQSMRRCLDASADTSSVSHIISLRFREHWLSDPAHQFTRDAAAIVMSEMWCVATIFDAMRCARVVVPHGPPSIILRVGGLN
jgi:hypothetical protein